VAGPGWSRRQAHPAPPGHRCCCKFCMLALTILKASAPEGTAATAGANRALGIPDKAFVLVDSVLITGLGRIALMPTLVLCARICPEVCTVAATASCLSLGAAYA
jgi:hypothetical protein